MDYHSVPPITVNTSLLAWLLEGDPAIRYQVYRDLLDEEKPDIQQRIIHEGWGARYLAKRNPDKHWGKGFYQPKWISSHYTLLDLRNLCAPRDTPMIRATIRFIVTNEKGRDGGINPSGTINQSDVCINGMFLHYAAWFETAGEDLESVINFILSQQLPDGGFNCRYNRSGARHSSLHSTLCILEGIQTYLQNAYDYRSAELKTVVSQSEAFILAHQLFRSDRTGDIIDQRMLRLSYPSRWKYDILRALDYFQSAGTGYDPRMEDALRVLIKKRRKDHTWPLQAKHPGLSHFEMEAPGQPSRWNTLRALRVLKHFQKIDISPASA